MRGGGIHAADFSPIARLQAREAAAGLPAGDTRTRRHLLIVPRAFQVRERPRSFADAFACEKHIAFVGDGDSLATRFGEESQVGAPERAHAVRKEVGTAVDEQRVITADCHPLPIA